MFETLAEELRNAREKNNLSLQQLSTRTKIDVKFLEAMETGDFAYLPEIYVKAFTKQYARAVGLDEEIIIKKYEAFKKGLPYEDKIPKAEDKKEIKPVKENIKEEKPKTQEQSKPESALPPYIYNAVKSPTPASDDSTGYDRKKILFGSVIVGLVVISAIIYFLFLRQSPEIIVPEKPIEDVIKENKQRFIEKNKPDSLINSTVLSDSLNLTIQAKDTSWVKIILDDKKVDEFIIFPGSKKNISAENNYKITFGNSGGIKLNLNNKPLNFTGKKNEIKYALIDKNGLKYLENPPSL
jgi:cytoskeletal protein RodZ